ncbi:TPA: hypothetical protein ACS8CE_003476 [Providencia alcalifaciens]
MNMGSIMLRTNEEQDIQIEELKDYLNKKTSSGAILEAATDYKAVCKQKDELERQLAIACYEIREMKAAISKYQQSQLALFAFSKE